MYETGHGVPQDDQEALKWYRLSAHQGLDDAQHNLGTLYAIGKGVPQDYTEAFKWYLLAAGNGNPLACGKLGLLYENGWGVPQDYVQAHMWFNLAGGFGLEQAFRSRDKLAIKMSSNQIAEAQQLAREWKPKGKATPLSQGTSR
jgi:TPR repeat protein